MITYFPASPNAFFINIPIPKATASAFGYFLPLIRDDFYKIQSFDLSFIIQFSITFK